MTSGALILTHAPLLIGLVSKPDWDPVADAHPFVVRFYRSYLCMEIALRALATEDEVSIQGDGVVSGGDYRGPYYQRGRFCATLRRPLDCGPLWEVIDRRVDEMGAGTYRHHPCPCAVCKHATWLAGGPWPYDEATRD